MAFPLFDHNEAHFGEHGDVIVPSVRVVSAKIGARDGRKRGIRRDDRSDGRELDAREKHEQESGADCHFRVGAATHSFSRLRF